jgi:XTP/dITP diphosphohydrolase
LKLLLATTSRGKLREQREALSGLGIELPSLEDFPDLETPEELGSSFRENAALKALHYHACTGLPAVSEDAGLVVDALGGAPGLASARFLSRDTRYREKNLRILELLRDVPEGGRTARYVSALALADEGKIVFEFEAICEGLIALEPSGEGGFGYDPIFFYPPLGKTMAEIPAAEKNRVSHRGKAFAALKTYLERSWNFDAKSRPAL